MKQIKTIKNRLDNNVAFDNEVNAALAEGWTLVKRDVINPHAHPQLQTFYTMLYAELEQDTDQTKKCCEACGMERCTDAPCVKGTGEDLKEVPEE